VFADSTSELQVRYLMWCTGAKSPAQKFKYLVQKKLQRKNYMCKCQIATEVIARALAQQCVKSPAQAIVWAITCVYSRIVFPVLVGLVLQLPQKSRMYQPRKH
jgi:hypothetical protein